MAIMCSNIPRSTPIRYLHDFRFVPNFPSSTLIRACTAIRYTRVPIFAFFYFYQVILDSDGASCQSTIIDIGALTTTTRSWDIYVTQVRIHLSPTQIVRFRYTVTDFAVVFLLQYTCGQEDEAGPRGCLQYFTGIGGDYHVYRRIKKESKNPFAFNFQLT